MAEFKITTARKTPVRSKIATARNPNARPTPILRKDASRVVGMAVILIFARLFPSTSKTRGIAINPMILRGVVIISGTSTSNIFRSSPRTAAYIGGILRTSFSDPFQSLPEAIYIPTE